MSSLFLPITRSAQTGFTLVELLVVLVILSIVTGATVFSLEGMQQRDAEQAVRRLAQAMQVAAESAEIRGTPIRLELQPYGYQFTAMNTNGEWQPLRTPKILTAREWYPGMSVRALVLNGKKSVQADRLLFTGADVPVFYLNLDTVNGVRTISGNLSGNVQMEDGDAEKAPRFEPA